jgi:hypothetical protein
VVVEGRLIVGEVEEVAVHCPSREEEEHALLEVYHELVVEELVVMMVVVVEERLRRRLLVATGEEGHLREQLNALSAVLRCLEMAEAVGPDLDLESEVE